MKRYSSREIIKLLKEDGWYLVGTTGSHHHFKHPTKPNKVTTSSEKGSSQQNNSINF